jgi:hypothetical protein
VFLFVESVGPNNQTYCDVVIYCSQVSEATCKCKVVYRTESITMLQLGLLFRIWLIDIFQISSCTLGSERRPCTAGMLKTYWCWQWRWSSCNKYESHGITQNPASNLKGSIQLEKPHTNWDSASDNCPMTNAVSWFADWFVKSWSNQPLHLHHIIISITLIYRSNSSLVSLQTTAISWIGSRRTSWDIQFQKWIFGIKGPYKHFKQSSSIHTSLV